MGILTGAVLVIGLSLFIIHDYDAERAFRDAFFNVSTIISTTGYANTDYMLWQPFIWFVLFLLMFIGGCAGSTAGGIKVVRYLLLFRNIPVQFRKLLHERGVIAARLNGEIVNEELIFRTLAFFIILFVYLGSKYIFIDVYRTSLVGINGWSCGKYVLCRTRFGFCRAGW
ncbi:MAG: TrkH family potassium uptake protein [Bacteroidales bacterium]|nr:TrkH family potassium uptake protein [Bacteroidales bacterium]